MKMRYATLEGNSDDSVYLGVVRGAEDLGEEVDQGEADL